MEKDEPLPKLQYLQQLYTIKETSYSRMGPSLCLELHIFQVWRS